MLAAVRCGEMQPIMLARTIATLDHMLEGRLTVNIISSDFPGEKADSAYPLPALARGGGDPETGLDAGRDQLRGRSL
jgi:alkanesulfonate monooxygenase SsuD/methylene tetrahydromethanopterin reductase-like flavin-dependent oxidoreductase (luciferase family)